MRVGKCILKDDDVVALTCDAIKRFVCDRNITSDDVEEILNSSYTLSIPESCLASPNAASNGASAVCTMLYSPRRVSM